MDRYVSDPIALPSREIPYTRADLVFYGVDHSGPTYEARIFFDNAQADESTERTLEAGYAGAFHIFGHGGCYGDVGHCDVPPGPLDAFDLRLPHPLTPVTKTVIVTEAVRRRTEEAVRVTVVPVVRGGDGPRREDVLRFDALTLLVFE